MTTPSNGNYVDGFVLPVPKNQIDAYRELATKAAGIWREHGALHYQECVLDDPSGEHCRTFADMAGAGDDETVIFAWAVFADRAARDEANSKIMSDPRMNEMCGQTAALFDCKRMAYAGFKSLVSL
jgi:uncharacterized protein YbaA (DUF1428 family)